MRDQEVKLAEQLIQSLFMERWDPQKYHDTYRERVLELIRKKEKGEETLAPTGHASAKVVDLMEALRNSLNKRETRKKAPARADRSRATPKSQRQRKAS